MPYKLTLVLTPKQAADVKYYTEQAARRAGVAEQDVALVRDRKSTRLNSSHAT